MIWEIILENDVKAPLKLVDGHNYLITVKFK